MYCAHPILQSTQYRLESNGLPLGLRSGVSIPYLPKFKGSLLTLSAGLRNSIIKMHFDDKPTPQERVYSSSIASGVAGGGVVWAISSKLNNFS